ncbi:MAG: UvrD-helicase domain-containing protein [Holosporaceae bacterium]|jgi:ATP-dependent helicase/nuclease subunit A|nr:UvrD-helicase domain-containing protein [Holosporaceae bacterium]
MDLMPNGNVASSFWISASAGTGKTKSLIDRILVLLLSGVQPFKILCLTYTRAAASEMLIRLSDYLQKLSKMPDDELKSELLSIGFGESFLKTAKSLYEKSLGDAWVSIQTIHSFCFRLLERFPLETGLFPGVKLCDDYQRKELIDQSINHVLAGKHENLRIVSEYTIDLSHIFKENTVNISRFVDLFSDFKKLYATFFDIDMDWIDLDDGEIDPVLFNKIFPDNYRKKFTELAKVLDSGSPTDRKNAEILRRNADNPTEEFTEVFLTKEETIRAKFFTSKITVPDFYDRMRAMSLKALDFIDAKKRIISAKANVAFFEVMEEIIEKFRELKISNHCLDFDDVILRAVDLLKNMDWVMYKTDSNLDHVLVDEAQDTSAEQWEVIQLITEEFFSNYQSNRTIFVVGDEKQSIYSFQGADVKLFNRMHEHFRERAQRCGQNFHDIPLNNSYRTTGNILSFIDDVFAQKFPGIRHTTNRNPNTGVVEIVDAFEEEKDVPNSAAQKLSTHVVNFIKKAIEEKVFVESRNREARAGDFIILFQKRNIKTMQYIINSLKKENIPVVGIDKIILNDELIVEDLIALAEFAVFPLDDLMCARVLKSPIIGMTEQELMQICLNRGDERLWDYIRKNNPMERLQDYVDAAFKLSPYDFFMHALTDAVKESFIHRLGEQCVETLHEFLDVVMLYENENTPSLQSFLEWFGSFGHVRKKESFAGANAVRLMTVHASKGLQSPFVILADCHFVNRVTNKLLKTKDGVLLWDFSANCRPQPIERLHTEKQLEEDNEFYRLLYVAMTRAEDFLGILAEKKPPNEKNWYNFLRLRLDKFVYTAYGICASFSPPYA